MADDRNASRSGALELLCRGGDRRLRGCIEACLVETEEDDITSLLGLRRESEQHAADGRQQELALHDILRSGSNQPASVGEKTRPDASITLTLDALKPWRSIGLR